MPMATSSPCEGARDAIEARRGGVFLSSPVTARWETSVFPSVCPRTSDTIALPAHTPASSSRAAAFDGGSVLVFSAAPLPQLRWLARVLARSAEPWQHPLLSRPSIGHVGGGADRCRKVAGSRSVSDESGKFQAPMCWERGRREQGGWGRGRLDPERASVRILFPLPLRFDPHGDNAENRGSAERTPARLGDDVPRVPRRQHVIPCLRGGGGRVVGEGPGGGGGGQRNSTQVRLLLIRRSTARAKLTRWRRPPR